MNDILVKTENPVIIDVIKNHDGRRYNLSNFNVKRSEDGNRYCVWCMKGKLHHGSQKYCSDPCRTSAFALMNPQTEVAIHILLHRQEYKCNDCGHDYMDDIIQIQERLKTTNHKYTISEPNYYLIWRLKSKHWRKQTALEVDHIEAIALGGQGIGLDNHQVLCKACHKEKTKKDVGKIAKQRRESR
jgi:5-methylcytosine-specific restriction endonuclease McrA